MNIGKAIIDICAIRGISQKELSEKSGLSVTFHSLLENGHRNASMPTMEKIAEILDVPVSVIYFFSISEKDVKEDKKQLYKALKDQIDQFIIKIFLK